MANSTIDSSKIILFDRWPGTPDGVLSVPVDGFTGSSHHNVSSPVFPVGTKIKVYDTTSCGYATLMYLQYIAGTKAATLALAVKQLVAMRTTSQSSAATTQNYYKVTDDGSESLLQTCVAVALSAMTDSYYGWFWVGGVVPVSFVAGLSGNIVTDGNLTAGSGIVGVANASSTSVNSDKIIFGLAMTGAAHATAVVDKQVLGISLIADA